MIKNNVKTIVIALAVLALVVAASMLETKPKDSQATGGLVIDITQFMGGNERVVENETVGTININAVFGGVQLDLTKAKIDQKAEAYIDVAFGGVEIIVPKDWQVRNEASAVFGGVSVPRQAEATDSTKILYLQGNAIFGGIEVRHSRR
jgi:predicted membrane protein